MEDSKIVDLYWARNESAITETAQKYGRYCRKIAMNVLNSEGDSEECVNDTYLAAWNSMPENRPTLLGSFLAAIVRNLSLDLYRKRHSQKRGDGQMPLVLDELLEVAGSDNIESEVDSILLSESINKFLGNLDEETRFIFIRRYFFADSLMSIADTLQISEGKTKTVLFRTRNKLKNYLAKEGYEV